MSKRALFLLFGSIAFLASCGFQVYEVKKGRLYRSQQPLRSELRQAIKTHELKSVLRLRGGEDNDYWYQQSLLPTREAGIDFFQLPLSASRFPKKWELQRLLEVFDQAEAPLLIHCKAGADRTGLAAALYWLHTEENMEKARKELALMPYGHTGWFKSAAMGKTLDMYEPWLGVITLQEWVEEVYQRPENDQLSDDFFEREQARVQNYQQKKKLEEEQNQS